MITTQQVVDRINELSNDKKLLKEFNKENGTNIESFSVTQTDTYCIIDVITKKFIYDMEVYDDTDGYCCYNLQLKETAWLYDFDDWVDEEDIRYMYELSGELDDRYNDVNLALMDMFPMQSDEKDLEYRVRYLIKFRQRIQECYDEHEGNNSFIVSFMKRICDNF